MYINYNQLVSLGERQNSIETRYIDSDSRKK